MKVNKSSGTRGQNLSTIAAEKQPSVTSGGTIQRKNNSGSFAYAYVRDVLAEQIRNRELSERQQLPSERELCERFTINRATLRQALSQLENTGLIFRRNRRGWFVCPRKLRYNPMLHVSFLVYAREQGFTPSTQVLFQEKITPPAHVAWRLHLPSGSQAIRVIRLRSVDDRPVLVECMYFHPDHFPNFLSQNLSNSITTLLKTGYHHKQIIYDVEVETSSLLEPFAEHLGVNEGAQGLKVTRLVSNSENTPIEYDEEHWRHDALLIETRTILDIDT